MVSNDFACLPNVRAKPGATRAEMVHQAERLAASAGLTDAAGGALFGGVYDTAAVIVLPYALTLAQDSLQSTRRVRISGDWMAVDWSEVSAHPRFELYCSAAKALLSSANLRRASDPAVMSPSAVDRGPNLSDDSSERLRRWDTSVTAAEDADVRLQLALRSIAATDADYSYLQECADIISAATRPSFDDVPAHLRQIEDDWDTSLVASMPFSKRFTPTKTIRIPQPAPQKDPSFFRPNSLAEILLPGAVSKIQAWLQIFSANAINMRHGGRPHKKQATLIIGQDEFVPKARGIVWDCRPFKFGLPAVPMDFSSTLVSDLNREFIKSEASSWPDQELVGMLLDGVQFQADVPLQFIFADHLASLPQGFLSVDSELSQHIARGWYDLFSFIPYAPCRFMPQGSAPKQGATTKFRRTTDGGCPRCNHPTSCADAAGVTAISLNTAIGLHSSTQSDRFSDGEAAAIPKWLAHEIKPKAQDVAHDMTILRQASLVFNEDVFGFSDDFANYFNQFALHPAEYWKSCLLWNFGGATPPRPSDLNVPEVSVVSEYRLGFGVSLSSSIGQRAAELVLNSFRRRFDEEEEALFSRILDPTSSKCFGVGSLDELSRSADGLTDACRWIQQRRLLSLHTGNNELRLYSAHVYTDDCIITVVGSSRMIRALRIWHATTNAYNIDMAGASKRQLGTRLTWIGFNFFVHAGVLAVTPRKVLKAKDTASRILSGHDVSFAEYRSFVGLLEHMLLFVGGDRTYMYHMYGLNFKLGHRYGPTFRMIFTALQIPVIRRWFCIMATSAGCFLSRALNSLSTAIPPLPSCFTGTAWAPLTPPISERIFLHSDAASESKDGGLGGYSHGDYWHIPLSTDERALLHITSLEFAAAGINLICNANRFVGHDVTVCVDALSSALVLAQAAYSPMMQAIHELILALPEFKLLAPRLRVQHIFGEVNVFADAASRGRFKLLETIAARVGVVARKTELPQRALAFFEDVKLRARQLSAAAFAATKPPVFMADAAAPTYIYSRKRPHHGFRGPVFSSNFAGDGPSKHALPLHSEEFASCPKISNSERSVLQRVEPSLFGSESFPFDITVTSDAGVSSQRTESPVFGLQLCRTAARAPSHCSDCSLRSESPVFGLSRSVATETVHSFLQQSANSETLHLCAGNRIQKAAPLVFIGAPLGASPSQEPLRLRAASSPSRASPAKTSSTPNALLAALVSDTSQQALRPSDPQVLVRYTEQVGSALAASVNTNTARKNKLGMRLWQEFTASLNTDSLRRQTAFLAREEFLVGAFIIFLTTKVRPKDPARSFAKPSTYLGYVFAVRREHSLLHLPFASNFVVNKVVDSLKKQYIALHGPEGLMPKRREPFSGDMVDRMLGAPNGLKFDSRSNPVLRWDSWLGINLAAAIAVSRAGGFRLAEIALAPDEHFDASRMSRASLFFILGGTLFRHPSTEQLHAASDGDQAGLLVGVAKNDQFVEHFGPHPLFFTLNTRNPNCPARRLITLELACPVTSSSRRSTPLFFNDTLI